MSVFALRKCSRTIMVLERLPSPQPSAILNLTVFCYMSYTFLLPLCSGILSAILSSSLATYLLSLFFLYARVKKKKKEEKKDKSSKCSKRYLAIFSYPYKIGIVIPMTFLFFSWLYISICFHDMKDVSIPVLSRI